MFQVKTYDVNQTTGIISFEVMFDIGTGPKTDKGSFLHKVEADKYLYGLKRDYILVVFEKYINHAKILHETGSKDFYRTPPKLEALDRLMRYNRWFQDKKLVEICTVILKLKDDLYKILPSPTNPSFTSSERKIIEMIVFCRHELENVSTVTVNQLSN